MIQPQLTGVWRLTDQIEQWDDGRRTQPRGSEIHGLISYTNNGWMSAILGRTTPRPNRDLNSLEFALEDTLAYGGRFSVDEDAASIHHHVRISSYNPLEGTDLVRTAELTEDNSLRLVGLRAGGGAQRILTWQRPRKGVTRNVDPSLVGAWLLEEYIAFRADGGTEHPMGLSPHGLLQYGADGWMSVIINRRDRPPQHPVGSEVFAFTEFICYYGRYTLDREAGVVTHYTEYSSYSGMHQTALQRAIIFLTPDLITLTAANPSGQVITLRWRRQTA
jgi:hypothetical protein